MICKGNDFNKDFARSTKTGLALIIRIVDVNFTAYMVSEL